jgi:aminopeptidase N
VVGDFQVETAVRNGRTFRMFHRETEVAKVARNKDAIFDLHATALAFMERYTGIPYAFGKFDFVLIPAFQFGGMEHAGKILYNASGLMLDESATQNQMLGRASVIAHETAHMWFGDLVTMRWFNDVWMKEVFANFMAAKIVNPSFPQVNHELRFLLSHYPSAYEVDRTPGANPIRQQLDNLNEAGSLYGAIIYQKAPIIMRHLEALLGEESFRDGLREYLNAHTFGNATWNDLIAVLDARTPTDLRAWSRVWVEQPGRPTITTRLETADGKVTRLAFEQSDAMGRGLVWPQVLDVDILTVSGSGHTWIFDVDRVPARLDGDTVEVPGLVGGPLPTIVLPSGGGFGYGDFVLDAASLDGLVKWTPSLTDPVMRGSAWVTLWDALLANRLSPAAFMDLAARALPAETDEQLTARVLNYSANTWWRFLPSDERQRRAAAFEQTLRDGLARAGTPSQKAAWFGALRNVALTAPTVAWLRKVWAKTETVPGPAAGRGRLHQPGAGTRRARGGGVEGDSGRAADADRESGSQGPVPVRDAGALGRPGRARSLVPVAEGRQQSSAGAVGARGAQLPAPPVAGAGVGGLHHAEPRDAVGDSEDRRHLLSRSAGSTPPSAATARRRSPAWCGRSWRRCRPTTLSD